MIKGDSPNLEVKGSVIRSCEAFIESRFGALKVDEIRNRLSDESRGIIVAGVLPSSWYPLSVLTEYLETVREHFKIHRFLLREMGRFSVDYQMNRFMRFIAGFITVEWAISRVPALWSQYYRPGTIQVTESEPGHVQVVLTEFPHHSTAFCERLCGWMQRLTEKTGVLNSHVEHPRCIGSGEDSCLYEIYWMAGSVTDDMEK